MKDEYWLELITMKTGLPLKKKQKEPMKGIVTYKKLVEEMRVATRYHHLPLRVLFLGQKENRSSAKANRRSV